MNQLIAFVGFKSSGKNTAADPLVRQGYLSLSFADAIKDSLASILCWPRELLEGITEESREWRETVDEFWAKRLEISFFTPRWALRHFGTEVMRWHFNPDIWVLNVERRIMLAGDVPIVIVDTRFDNEINMVRRLGGRIARIKRGSDPSWMGMALAANRGDQEAYRSIAHIHESERSWIGCNIDATLSNDGTIIELQNSVLCWLNPGDEG